MKNRGMAILDELLKLGAISKDQHEKNIYRIFNIISRIYCIKEKHTHKKKKTKIDPTYVMSKTNRLILKGK